MPGSRCRRQPWPRSLLLCALLTGNAGTLVQADSTVYRCEDGNGVRFSDQPCGPNPETITIHDTRMGSNLGVELSERDQDPVSPESGEPASAPNGGDPCRFISSTDLRTYIIREQVVPGMTREQVEKAFGPTPEIYPGPEETWVYQRKYYGALYELTYIYFRNGCVDRVVYRQP